MKLIDQIVAEWAERKAERLAAITTEEPEPSRSDKP